MTYEISLVIARATKIGYKNKFVKEVFKSKISNRASAVPFVKHNKNKARQLNASKDIRKNPQYGL